MRKIIFLLLTVLLICPLFGAIADDIYLSIEPFSEGLAAVQSQEHLWGYIDTTGEIVIPCEYTYAGIFSDGVACVRKDCKYGSINTSGQIIVDCIWKKSAFVFSEGLAAVQNEEGLWGFIDMTGKVIIPFEWEGIITPKFSDGLAAIQKNNMMGFINKTGDTVISLKYKFCEAFSHGYALVQDNYGLQFIDSKGMVAFPVFPHAIQADSFREDRTAFLNFDKYTGGVFIDTDGQIICALSDEYRIRSNFREGLAGIAKADEENTYEGYIDQNGTIVIPLKLYTSHDWYRNGRVCIPDGPITEKNIHYGVIDRSENLVYPFSLDKKVEFEEIVASAVQNGRVGAIDINGNTVVPFDYDDIKVGNGIILCLNDGKISLFDYEGGRTINGQ